MVDIILKPAEPETYEINDPSMRNLILGVPRRDVCAPPKLWDNVSIRPSRINYLARPKPEQLPGAKAGCGARLAAASAYRVPEWLGGNTSAIKDGLVPPGVVRSRKKPPKQLRTTAMQDEHRDELEHQRKLLMQQIVMLDEKEREMERELAAKEWRGSGGGGKSARTGRTARASASLPALGPTSRGSGR